MMVTDTELAEVEARANEHFWTPLKADALALLAELRRLRGMRCETCMYWLHGLYPEDYCKLTISKDNKGRDDTLAHAHGASASYAMLCVKPDFGCNQWTPPKEATP